MKFDAIIIEHGHGLNEHLFYIWSSYKPIGSSRLYRCLQDSGVRTTLSDCHEAIYEFAADCEQSIKTITINS